MCKRNWTIDESSLIVPQIKIDLWGRKQSLILVILTLECQECHMAPSKKKKRKNTRDAIWLCGEKMHFSAAWNLKLVFCRSMNLNEATLSKFIQCNNYNNIVHQKWIINHLSQKTKIHFQIKKKNLNPSSFYIWFKN